MVLKQQILSVGGTKLLILTSSPRGDPCLFGCLLLSESFFGCKGPLQTKKSNIMNSELMSLRFPAPIQWVLNYVWRGERNNSDSFYVISRYYSNPDTRAVYPTCTSASVLTIPQVFLFSDSPWPFSRNIFLMSIMTSGRNYLRKMFLNLLLRKKNFFNHPPRVSHDLNPLTPKIWWSILPSGCYTLPCKLVMRIWC